MYYLLHGSWWQPISHLKGQITGMVSNPPYIPTQELPTLQPEVFQHEPHLALDGGDDGLDAIRYLAQSAPNYLVSGGIWLIEMMAGQGAKVVNILSEQRDYQDIQIIQDLSQIERFVFENWFCSCQTGIFYSIRSYSSIPISICPFIHINPFVFDFSNLSIYLSCDIIFSSKPRT